MTLGVFYNCDTTSKEPSEIKYVVFYEVGVEIDSQTEEFSFFKKREQLSQKEINQLEKVLLDLNWGYKVTVDSLVLIYAHYLPDIESMHNLNNLWKIEMQKSINDSIIFE